MKKILLFIQMILLSFTIYAAPEVTVSVEEHYPAGKKSSGTTVSASTSDSAKVTDENKNTSSVSQINTDKTMSSEALAEQRLKEKKASEQAADEEEDDDEPDASSDKLLNEGKKSSNKFVAFFAGTFNFVRHLPFSLDIGTEGANHGSTSYFSGSYAWKPSIISYFKLEVKNTLDNTSSGIFNNESYEYSSLNHSIQFLPFEQHLFFNKSKTHQFTYGVGFDFRMEHDKVDIKGTGELTSEIVDSIVKVHPEYTVPAGGIYSAKVFQDLNFYALGPLIRLYFRIPFNKFMVFNSETFITPIMFLMNKEKADSTFNLGQNLESCFSDSLYKNEWSNSEISESMHLDFFNFAAVVVNGRYMHQRMTSIVPYTVPMISTECICDSFTLKAGICLISVGKTFVRLKTGLFYEHNWKNYKYLIGDRDDTVNLDSGQFKISLGVDY